MSEVNTTKLSTVELTAMIIALQARVEQLEAQITKPKVSGSPREMTEADALAVITGEHKDAKHQAAADALGLSYGQVYSARLGYTFKPLHKALKEQGTKNAWAK